MFSLAPKLALTNLIKNRQTYLPYFLTGTLCAAMYYVMQAISMNEGLMQVPGAALVLTIFWLGTIVIGIFCVALLFYTNSFLIKRRTAEFGLYGVLGMEKRHIALVLFFETLFTAIVCIGLGIGLGALFSKLLFLGLLYVMDISTPLAFTFSVPTAVTCALLFLCIYGATLLYNLHRIHVSKPVDLLSARSAGEKEPKSSLLLTVVGVLALGYGYYTAVTVNDPLNALLLFFLAVLAVILGTFCLFTAGSIALLKFLKKRKGYYYKPEHFISVSGMMYRMKQNAAGLAAICVLFTMVLVTVSTTVCLYSGRDDMINNMYPTDIVGTVRMNGGDLEGLRTEVSDAITKSGSLVEQEHLWRSLHVTATLSEDGALSPADGDRLGDAGIELVPLADYNQAFGQNAVLEDGEALVWTRNGKMDLSALRFGGEAVVVKEYLDDFGPLTGVSAYIDPSAPYYPVVVKDEAAVGRLYTALTGQAADLSQVSLYLNVSGSPAQQQRACEGLFAYTSEAYRFIATSRAGTLANWNLLYGSFLFLGIYLGCLFMMATVLIIYYKQLSEGYDDHDRFVILQQVGMSQKEVRTTINKQVLLVFFLPLGMALLHMLFAFNIIANMLVVFGMTNRTLFAICCLVIFCAFSLAYLLVYRLTSKTYYKLVKA